MRTDTAILELQRAPAVRCAVGWSLVRQHGGEEHNAAGFKRHGNGLALVDAVGQDLAVDGVVVSERTESVAAWQTCIQPLSMVVSSRAIQAVATLYRGSQLK